MSAVNLLAGAMLAGLVMYSLPAGADYGAGFWDLTCRGPRQEQQRHLSNGRLAPFGRQITSGSFSRSSCCSQAFPRRLVRCAWRWRFHCSLSCLASSFAAVPLSSAPISPARDGPSCIGERSFPFRAV